MVRILDVTLVVSLLDHNSYCKDDRYAGLLFFLLCLSILMWPLINCLMSKILNVQWLCRHFLCWLVHFFSCKGCENCEKNFQIKSRDLWKSPPIRCECLESQTSKITLNFLPMALILCIPLPFSFLSCSCHRWLAIKQ